MMSKLWLYLSAGGAFVIAALYFLWQRAAGKADEYRDQRDQERDNRNVVERIREKEGDIREAENQARNEAAENAEDIEGSRRGGERDRGLNNDRLS